ncbi:BRCA2 repeat domain protein [Nitzschia inconspicua]|uniref:BRCA2 repeat domain protein n=1 Tax=Nitzschia inconspicua TaxID=303405 RepID=A0A9K3KPY0_9STRA|nr:BRCA2 repeat domain protein [Nitzschia inconspicua]
MSSSSSDDWACSYCTLWNPPTKRRCAACQARRQVDLSVPTAVPVVDTTTNRRRKLSKTSPPSRKRHRPVTTPTVTSNATTSSAKETNISTTTSSTSSDRYISQPSSDVVLIPDKELASQTTNSKYKNGSDPTDPGIQQESCDARNGFSSPKPDGKRETSPIDSLTDYQPRQTSANEHSGQLCQKSNAASMILQGDCAVDENIQGDSNNSVETNPAVGTSLPKLPIVGDVSSTRRRKEEIMDETIDRTCNNNNGIGNDGTHRPWDDSTAKHILNHVPNRLNENKLLQSPTTSSGGDGTGNVQQPGYEIESSFLATEKENFQGNQNQETYLLLESTIVSDSVTNNDSSSGNVPVVNVHPRSMTDFSIRGNDTYLQDVNETLEEATSEEAIQQGTNNPIHHTLSAVTAVPQADDLPLLTSGIQPQFENNNLSQSSSCVSPKQTFFDYTPPSQLSQESERKAIPTGISHSNPANDAVECDNTELVVNLDHQQYFYRVDEQSEKILWHKREDSQEATKMSVVEKVCSIKDQKTPGLQRIGNVGTIDADESVNIESAIQLVRHSTLPFSDHNSKHHTQSRYESQADAILQAISSNATATLTKNAVHQASQLRQDTISDMDHSTTLFPQEPTCQSLRKRPLEEALQDSRSSKCQMLPAFPNPSAVPLFHTAGKGMSICVSKESLEKVGKMFEESVGSAAISNPTIPLFQTAGKGTSISVSKESLEKVGNMFEVPVGTVPVSNSTVPLFQTAGKGTSIAVSKESLEKVGKMFEVSVGSAAVSNPTISLFQTAGKGTSIAVSRENLEKVEEMFEDPVGPVSVSNSTVPLFQTAGKGTSIAVSKVFEESVDFAAVSNATVPFFQTAGKGTPIAVTKDSLEKVVTMFEEPVDSAAVSNPTIPLFQTAGKATSIAVSKESLEKVGKMFEESVESAAVSKATVPLFQTAGKGTSIAVSKERLEKARKMFEDLVDSAAVSNPTIPLFQTAGKGTSIAVSKESLEKVGKIFEDPVGAVPKSNSTVPFFQTAGKGTSIAVSKESLEKVGKMFEESVGSAAVSNPTLSLFQTAGKGTSIAVSKESLEKVGKMFEDPFGAVPKSNSTVPFFQTAGKGTSIAVSKESLEKVGKMFEESVGSAAVSNPTLSLFQTAGKGTSIAVSKESLEKVGKMFEDPVSAVPKSNSTVPFFQTAGKGTSIAVSKESLEKVGKMFEDPVGPVSKSNSTVPFFQTTGKGTSIAVSKESLEKVGKMFEESVGSAAVSNPTLALFQTAGKGTSIAVSKESLEKVGKMFEDPVGAVPKSNSTVPFFQTAGKGTSIAVSKESLEKVGKMFEESVGSAAVSNPTLSLFQTAGKGTSIAVSKESLEKAGKMFEDPGSAVPVSSSTVPLFQTAGKGTSIAVSKESLEKVGKMFEESVGSAAVSNPTLSLFQTAGKGTSIAVSKESLEKVGKMFEDPVSAVPISNSTVPFFQTAGKGASIAVSKESLAKADKLLRKVESDYFYDSLSSKGLSATRSIEEQEGVEWHRNNDVVLSKEGNVFSCDYKTRTSLYTLADVENTITLDEEQVTTTPDHPTFSRSARVTIATDDEFFVRKHLPGQLSFMTPVPLKYNGEEGTCNADIEIPVIHSDSVQESKDTVCLNLSYAQKYGLMSSSHDECVAHGVREATIKVNSLNALQIAFDNDGFPATILSDARSDSESDRLLRDIRRSLIEEGCDSLQLKDKWIRIHARWVIWKLAAYERRFSRFLAGRHLTYDRLIHDLKSRFQREMVEGRRSPLRRILNCDASPKTMMILVVSQTLSSPSMKDGDCKLQKLKILEVSDGWHAIKAELDSKLSKFVENNLIKVGTKLLVSNAQIVGVGEGVDPLDTSSEGDSALLQLSANATRLARWNAKLGLVKVSPSQAPKGRLLLKRLSDVVEGGGNVPAISLFIQRVYPIMYYEKSEGDSSNPVTDSSTCRQVLSEQEEENRRREFEGKKTRAVEYVTEKIQAEIEQEVDQDAPEVWKRVYNSSTPEDMYQTLAESDQEEIARWREHRSTLIQRRIQDEVEAELETHKSLLRKSAPFLRIKVHSVYPRKHKRESGLLTIWHPSEEHLNSLKEGSCVQAFDLSVRDTLYNGQLQLTANKRTIIEALPEDSFSETKEQVFVERRYLSLIDVHMISHIKAKESEDADPVEFDTVATCFNVTESSKTDEVVLHLIDETCLVLRVHCKSLPYILKVLLGEESGVITSFALRDLRLRSFDTHQQCAVAEFTDLSSVISTNDRIEELAFWAENEGSAEVLAASTRLEVGLPEWEQCEEERVGFGYIMGLRVEEKSQTLYIQVDCCGFCCQDWELPFSVLQNMVSVDSPGVTSSIHSPSLENRMERLGLLGLILRSRGTLWEFQLRLNRKHSNFNAFVVTKATPANNSMLCNLYLTLPELELPDAKEEGVTF